MSSQVKESDQLRQPEKIYDPDPRHSHFVKLDFKTGQRRNRVIDDQHEAISCFTLNEYVPVDIATHFETAKNLYLYAWFVYRFYSVAEQQAFASLEFALRERFPDFVGEEKKKHKRGFEPGLKQLMGYAINEGFVKNEGFSTREYWARMRAVSRYKHQKSEEMRNAGVESWVIDESEAVVTQEDLDYDWLGDIQKIIPKIRNLYAHGSWHLYPAPVRHTFEIVSEIINQLYPKAEAVGDVTRSRVP